MSHAGRPASALRAVTISGPAATHPGMGSDDALVWLRQVDGQLYRNNPHASGKKAWVAVVRAPGADERRGTLIIALGSTMEEAAAAAAGRWHRLHGPSPTLH